MMSISEFLGFSDTEIIEIMQEEMISQSDLHEELREEEKYPVVKL